MLFVSMVLSQVAAAPSPPTFCDEDVAATINCPMCEMSKMPMLFRTA